MNKRIRELAMMASAWCEQNAQGTPVAWEWEEKFAELIVRECIVKCDHVAIFARGKNNDAYEAAASIKHNIEEHFGVE